MTDVKWDKSDIAEQFRQILQVRADPMPSGSKSGASSSTRFLVLLFYLHLVLAALSSNSFRLSFDVVTFFHHTPYLLYEACIRQNQQNLEV